MTRGLFITGTDTGVGKTVVTAALATGLRGRGVHVGVMKPVETGCPREAGQLLPEDALFLIEASGCTAPLEVVNPYALAEPLAPALAAERTGTNIDLERIRVCYLELATGHDVVLVEGAGGLLVPLTDRLTMLDLAAELQLDVLIVSRNALGTINHTSLTVMVARQRGLRVVGVIVNNPSFTRDLATETNIGALRRWAGAPILAEIPYMPVLDQGALLSIAERLEYEVPVAGNHIHRG